MLETGMGVNADEGLGEFAGTDFGVGETTDPGEKTVGLANGENLEGIPK